MDFSKLLDLVNQFSDEAQDQTDIEALDAVRDILIAQHNHHELLKMDREGCLLTQQQQKYVTPDMCSKYRVRYVQQ